VPPYGVLITQFRDHQSGKIKSTAEKYKACKVDAVRASTAVTPVYGVPYRSTPSPTIAKCSDVNSEEVEKLISSAPRKTYQADPAPTWLMKDMRKLLSPFIS